MFHRPYSPDLSRNDFFIFPRVKHKMHVQRFPSHQENVDAL